MGLASSFSRLADYYRRNGSRATFGRLGVALRRSVLANRTAVFYLDLRSQELSVAELPSHLDIERKRSESEMTAEELQRITSFWNPKLARRNLKERFGLGASLWLIKRRSQIAGCGWTLQGRTVEPHYLKLGNNDVHLFDFHVFPEFRGRGLNPVFVINILNRLSLESEGRAFIEAAEWNQAQLRSLAKTPFKRLGLARKLSIMGRTVVSWDGTEAKDSVRGFVSRIPPGVLHRNRPDSLFGPGEMTVAEQKKDT